jgi:hypothetical protein
MAPTGSVFRAGPMLSQQHSFKRSSSHVHWGDPAGAGSRLTVDGPSADGYTASLMYTKALAGAKLSMGASVRACYDAEAI